MIVMVLGSLALAFTLGLTLAFGLTLALALNLYRSVNVRSDDKKLLQDCPQIPSSMRLGGARWIWFALDDRLQRYVVAGWRECSLRCCMCWGPGAVGGFFPLFFPLFFGGIPGRTGMIQGTSEGCDVG